MIIKEFYRTRKDNVNLYHIYSNQQLIIRQIETGKLYDEVIDVENAPYSYEETKESIQKNYYFQKETIAPDEISAEEFMALVEEVL